MTATREARNHTRKTLTTARSAQTRDKSPAAGSQMRSSLLGLAGGFFGIGAGRTQHRMENGEGKEMEKKKKES